MDAVEITFWFIPEYRVIASSKLPVPVSMTEILYLSTRPMSR